MIFEKKAREILNKAYSLKHRDTLGVLQDAALHDGIAEALRTVRNEALRECIAIADVTHDENSDPYAKASAAHISLRISELIKDTP